MLIHILYTGPDIYIIQKRGDPGIFGTQTWALWFYLDSMEGYQLHSVILQEVISCLLEAPDLSIEWKGLNLHNGLNVHL